MACKTNFVHKNIKIVSNATTNNPIKSVRTGYLVWSPQCKMLSLEPLAADVMKLFSKEEFEPCSRKRPLTSIEQNFEEDTVKVVFHRGLKSKYLNTDQNQLDCCYQEITRGGVNATADDKFK